MNRHQLISRLLTIVLSVNLFIAGCTQPDEDHRTFFDQAQEPNRQQNAVSVRTAKVSAGNFQLQLISNGKAVAQTRTDLRLPLTGLVQTVLVKNGDWVRGGQVLAVVDQTEALRKVTKAKLDLNKALIDFKDRLIDFGYALKDSANVPKEIFSAAKIKSGYAGAKFDLEEAESNFRKCTILAPTAGKIANLDIKAESYSDGTSRFCTIIDDSKMEIKFALLESEYEFTNRSKGINVMPFGSNLVFNGSIIQRNPTIDENGLIKITGLVSNVSGQLVDGMNVKVNVNREVADRLFVPKEAVIQRQNKYVVFLCKNGHAVWQYVNPGHENDKYIEIDSGLVKGQTVIVSNIINLADNSSVKVEE